MQFCFLHGYFIKEALILRNLCPATHLPFKLHSNPNRNVHFISLQVYAPGRTTRLVKGKVKAQGISLILGQKGLGPR